jgi:hypothetical protein
MHDMRASEAEAATWLVSWDSSGDRSELAAPYRLECSRNDPQRRNEPVIAAMANRRGDGGKNDESQSDV